jgi:hypothetical protein
MEVNLRFGQFFKDLNTLMQSITYFPPWGIATSLLGSPSTWFSEPRSEMHLAKFTGFNSLDDLKRSINILASIVLQRVSPFRGIPGSVPQNENEEFQNEKWFYVNGICTNKTILELNGYYLRDLFHRPIELIENPTDGFFVDLFECVFGRTFDMVTEPCGYTLNRVEDALRSSKNDRVVLMGHSQGGIIISNVVKELVRKYAGQDILLKLEVYTFASAADEMASDDILTKRSGRLVPYIEHYANCGDFVARMGILQRHGMAGEIYEINKEGHLLNAHYLPEISARQYRSACFGNRARLYEYLDGGSAQYFNHCKENIMQENDFVGAMIESENPVTPTISVN